MHASAEDFTIEESCSLERIDLIDAPNAGNLRLLDAAAMREDYWRMVMKSVWGAALPAFAPLAGAVLDRAVPLHVGVIGSGTERVVTKFFETLGWPAQIQAFPLDMSADFRRHTRSAQKIFAQTLTNQTGLGVWIGGVGERIRWRCRNAACCRAAAAMPSLPGC
jgi:hypothetical protein